MSYCSVHGQHDGDGCQACLEAQDQAREDAARLAVYTTDAINNPGDYYCPHCKFKTLLKRATRCVRCHGEVRLQYWIDIEKEELDARLRKEKHEKEVREQNTIRDEEERIEKGRNAVINWFFAAVFGIPIILLMTFCSSRSEPKVSQQEQFLSLATTHKCIACHEIDKTLVGPAWRDVAARYRGVAGAEDKLIHKVTYGGAGVWGNLPEIPHRTTSQDDIRALVQFILSIK